MKKMPFRIAVIINLDANEGRARIKWRRIEKELKSLVQGELVVKTYTVPFRLNDYIKKLISTEKIRNFIVGGGDGTIHYFIQELSSVVGLNNLHQYTIGALGLGSSNDFIKPVKRRIGKVPVRLGYQETTIEDLGLVKIHKPGGIITSKLFLLNAGLGVIAQANHQYNNADKITSYLKKRATSLSILFTAIKTILNFQNIGLDLTYGETVKKINVSNLSITLTPYISGKFHYKKTKAGKGYFDMFICHGMNKIKLLITLIALLKGKFKESENRTIEKISRLVIVSSVVIPLETDGEIYEGNKFEFKVLKNVIQIMN